MAFSEGKMICPMLPRCRVLCSMLIERLSENAHLPLDRPFDKLTVVSKVEGLMALSKVAGLRYPHPWSLRRTSMYASFLGISEALHLAIFHQPLRSRVFDSLVELIDMGYKTGVK